MKPTEAQRVNGPLSSLLVSDLTHVLNGPFGTTILSDLGARVIKVEPPGHGDDTRTYGPLYKGQSLYFSFINRGKESIVLNLKEAGGVRMPGNPIKISGYEDPALRVGAPSLDEHGASIRREFAPQTVDAS